MAAFFLWIILFILCWPLALLALVLYPFVWLLTLPFRLVGIAVHGVLGLVSAIFRLPVRLLRGPRSEEHTSELQSRSDLVCRLLLEKKKKKKTERDRCN